MMMEMMEIKEMIVFFSYYPFIIYRVFLKCFYINILNWYRSTNSPLERREDDLEALPKGNCWGLETTWHLLFYFLILFFKFVQNYNFFISFWFHFKDNIVNYLSKINFLKTLHLYLVSSSTHSVSLWGALKPVWEA